MRSTHLLVLALLATSTLITSAAEKLQFNRDIRPILSDKCFHCHGPDPKKRESGVRLDLGDSMFEKKAIIRGNAESSGIIQRILSHDADEHMPPASSKLEDLTASEVATLKRWINEGAEYEAHWAFQPLKPSASSKPKPQTTAQQVDQSIARELASRGLKPQPRAARETLLRRLSFDLTGLPPTAAEVEALRSQADDSAAYEALVDRLLGSPRYGERMASDWLDVARYADSYGFQVDRAREVWPWRDWVVKAFNDNLPFDQFVTWQLAGDLLHSATDEQVLATAFNRLHQQESEGGSVEEEYRVEYVCDRVQTFATAFLGLTFECARCHDHKFDPITQADYYGLFSMFQNIDEAGLYAYFTQSPPTPALALMEDKDKAQMQALNAKVAALEQQLGSRAKATAPDTAAAPSAAFTFDVLAKGNELANSIKDGKPAKLKGENKLVPGQRGMAIEFTGDDPVDLALGNFHRHDPFSVSLSLRTPDVKERAVVFHRSQAWTDAGSRGYELLIEEGRLKWSLIHFWPGNAISIRARESLPVGQWVSVLVTNNGSSRAAGLQLFINGKPAAVDIIKDNLTKDITGGGHDFISLGERMRDRGFKGGAVDDFIVYDRDVTQREDDPQVKALLAELKQARAAVTELADKQREIMVMRELPQPKPTFILTRGEYDKRGAPAVAATPAVLPPLPAGAPRNRLGLAQWLTAPQHPLLARVTVNRLWQSLFGRGLVKTAEDLGSQGSRPLYPEVINALAEHFIASGWDMKQLVKTIVLTHTYQQRSVAEAQVMADDPENEWLARGPRFRLSAEMIRDNALAAAGLLSPTLGGAPVNAYEMSEAYKPASISAGDGVYRRSLYSNWQRTSPPPAMVAFDAPRRAVCSAKRERTDSPLQALILLNGTQYLEAARVLGERLHTEAKGDVTGMVQRGFLHCLSRQPDARELAILAQLHREQLAHFTAHPAEATALLKTGNAKPSTTLAPASAAAAAMLAQALLNHDECVVKR